MPVPGKGDVAPSIAAVAEDNINLIFQRGIRLAKSLVWTGTGCMHLLIANLRNKPQHLSQGTVVAHIDEIVEASEALTISAADRGYDAEARQSDVEVNPGLSPNERRELLHLLST